jgi:quinol monooxygenase YgiN
MLTVVAKLKVGEGKEAPIEAACREMVARVKADEADTLTYLFHRSRRDGRTFLFFERYGTRAALDAHLQSPHMATLLAAIGPLLDGAPEVETYEEIDGKR